MIHPDTELRLAGGGIGYGVFATRPIARGTVTWTRCAFDRVFDAAEVRAMAPGYREVLSNYAYIDAGGRFVLCWDLARYVNHSCEPTSLGVGPDVEIAVGDIAAGDQLTSEYGALNPVASLVCRCGAQTCRGVVRADDAVRYGGEWDARVRSALPAAIHVDQPLWPFVAEPDLLRSIIDGRLPLPTHRAYYRETSGRPSSAPATSGLWRFAEDLT